MAFVRVGRVLRTQKLRNMPQTCASNTVNMYSLCEEVSHVCCFELAFRFGPKRFHFCTFALVWLSTRILHVLVMMMKLGILLVFLCLVSSNGAPAPAPAPGPSYYYNYRLWLEYNFLLLADMA